ncbi:MAG: alpha/beta hydrolase [Gammaproteobacteria bacterium]|nr:alpha/beta hydrolase [Gammaproteobacteria bacterium]
MTEHLREEKTFRTEDGTRLHSWYYPAHNQNDAPCVVLSHGFSAIKSMGLAQYAECFAAAGIASLVYDHRNYGQSEGEPRHESNPWTQVHDMRDAISFAQTLSGVDAGRIGVWGTSYSGGHAIVVGAIDRRVKCVVAQVPLVSGPSTLRQWIPAALLAKMRTRFESDRLARANGEAPRMTTSSREGDETWEWKERVDTAGEYANETTQRSLEYFEEYEPTSFIGRIGPTPLLMIIANRDTSTPTEGQLTAYNLATEPKKLIVLDARHYDVYTDLFDQSAGAARDWFTQHL